MFGKRKQDALNDAVMPKNSTEEIYFPKGANISHQTDAAVGNAITIIYPLMMEKIDVGKATELDATELVNYLRPFISDIMDKQKIQLNTLELEHLESRLVDDMIGLGPLEPLLADDTVNDILVNNYDKVFVERFGKLQLSNTKFRSNNHVMNVITKIISSLGRRIDESTPYVDARLKDGSRVNAIIPPLALDGPSISIRKFREQHISLDDMIANGNLSHQMASFLSLAVQARQNIIISGGTGSGKTTMLNALSINIPSDERIITIEDSAELRLLQPHLVRLETRPPNLEGKGQVTERDLVKNALRMRPDRIILGEIRSGEAFDMLQAMNTGHDGSMCTIHASHPTEVTARLNSMVLMAGFELPNEAIMNQIADSVNILVQVSRMRDGIRRITHISEVLDFDGNRINIQDIFIFKHQFNPITQTVQGEYVYSEVRPKCAEAISKIGMEAKLNEALGHD